MESITHNGPGRCEFDQYLRSFDGWPLRYQYWHAHGTDGRGTIVVLGGRTEFIEKYTEIIGEINSRGFDALCFDWRGQGLSGRILPNPQKGYVETYDHYVRDLHCILENCLTASQTRPVYIMAHSMGAHIALRYLGQYANGIAKAILIAPRIQVRTFPAPVMLVRLWSRWMVRTGWHAAAAPTIGRNDSFFRPFAFNCLTSDRARFDRMRKLMLDHPHLTIRGITFGWLDATFQSIEKLRQPGYVSTIETPVLLVTAQRDRVVDNRATAQLASDLPNHRLAEVVRSNHEILQERSPLRQVFWHLADEFIA